MSTEEIFDKSLKITNYALKLIGVDLTKRKVMSPLTFITDNWYYYFNIWWMYSDVAGEIYWFIDAIRSDKTFGEFTFVAPCIVMGFLSHSKINAVYSKKNDMISLLDDLKKLYPHRETEQIKDDDNEKENIINEADTLIDRVLKLLIIVNVFLNVTFCALPIFIIFYVFYKTKELKLMTPFIIKYPFDAFDLRIWPFVYLHQCWSCK